MPTAMASVQRSTRMRIFGGIASILLVGVIALTPFLMRTHSVQAHATRQASFGSVSVFATGLNNPRGLTFGALRLEHRL